MSAASELDQLLADYLQMDAAAQPARAKALLLRAAELVDRSAAPLKWAALRSRFADLAELDEPQAAVTAYRDALTVWHPTEQHDPWVHCHLQLGCLLATSPPGSDDAEQALQHLRQALPDNPYLARLLATLYAFRPLGDPVDNWRQRMACLAMALSQTDRLSDPVPWAKVSNELACAHQDEPQGDFAAALEKRIAGHQAVLAALQAPPLGAGSGSETETAPAAEPSSPASGAARQAVLIDTCLQLATAYLDRVAGTPVANGQAAEALVQQALQACAALPADAPADPATTVQLLLVRARCLVFKQGSPQGPEPVHGQDQVQVQALNAALGVLAQARALAADRPQPELRGSVEKLQALACLALLRRGQHQHLGPFLTACGAALALFDGPSFGDERRKLWQIQADGLLAVGELAGAAEACAAAMALAEQALAQAVSTAGRLERIWALRDSAGLLAHCLARRGALAQAIDALDAGKARLWAAPGPASAGHVAQAGQAGQTGGADQTGEASQAGQDSPAVAPASAWLSGLIPAGGAVLMPVLAAEPGLVIIATQGAAGSVLTLVELPDFGQAQVLKAQRGDNPAELGGWLRAYCFRRSAPERFRAEIDTLAEWLGRVFWAPVLTRLTALGLAQGAELLLLPQGASASLPLQAAWCAGAGPGQASAPWLTERHALRFAPSLRALANTRHQDQGSAEQQATNLAQHPALPTTTTIIAANPDGDLHFDAFEVAWIQAVCPQAQVLAGAEATAERVLAALHTSSQVHVATHAEFNLDDPLASRLRVAGGALTVAQLASHLASARPAFMALSACDTGVTRVTSLADEFLGFPAALLAAGVRTVLATQWSVDDAASALLMGQFYRERAAAATADSVAATSPSSPPSPAQCLRRAQNWLRTLTVAELSQLLRPLRDAPGRAGELASALRARLRGRDDAECPYAHPYHWAGFCVLGGA